MESRIIADRFEVLRPLGEGSFGAVYLAVQHPIERKVAIKVMRPELGVREDLRRRFFREAKTVAKLKHPATVTLHD